MGFNQNFNQVKTNLYHFELGIPKSARTKIGNIPLRYSAHALNAAQDDRNGQIALPVRLNTNDAQVIEVEMRGSETLKVVYRVPYNKDFDLVLVVIPYNGMTKTVWLNSKKDLHRTLDKSRYAQVAR
jgi:hypothetical protein